MNIKIIKHFTLSFFFFLLNINILFAFDLKITGNKKYQIDNFQKLTNIDLSKDLNTQEIDTIVKDFYKSDIITNVKISFDNNHVILEITEATVINSIYFNNNVIIKDDELNDIISTKKNSLFNESNLSNDLNKIRSFYISRGYSQSSINVTSEYFSEDRINIIFDIYEGKPSRLSDINFVRSNFFQIMLALIVMTILIIYVFSMHLFFHSYKHLNLINVFNYFLFSLTILKLKIVIGLGLFLWWFFRFSYCKSFEH